ncbi:glycosyltransferase family 4 protein [Candidatus Stoquefichus sp. SB1]|uniref:glycosyltransferase family 4 protein n=1 Tax=Candidatus Stoquefichus sp. SB1 TaxID=1658109 RepID=UPI00067F6C68|nr:glycosyltransferase family 4 protein [Candidatus Stoquefichus sp. SB1]
MSKYVFISNSTKPNQDEYESLEDIKLSNVNRPCLKIANEMGYDVILGVNRKYPEKLKCPEMDITFYDSHTFRSIFAFKDNYIAYKNLCEILKKGEVEVIHCNTPIGGFIGRVCGKKYKVPKVIYTAHGFHFYKGAPLFYNTIIKWIEFFLAHWTDVIITMNEEDYQNALKMKLRNNGKVYKVNGVGINIEEISNIDLNRLDARKSMNINMDEFVCIGVGRIEKNKNYEMCIKAIHQTKNKNIHFLICGDGKKRKKLEKLAKKLNVEKQIHFLGYREDVFKLLKVSDCYLSTSKREGLPRALMEAMSVGLPCIVSDVRGNRDLINHNEGGFLVSPKDYKEIGARINLLVNNPNLRKEMSNINLERIKAYDVKGVNNLIKKIYLEVSEI